MDLEILGKEPGPPGYCLVPGIGYDKEYDDQNPKILTTLDDVLLRKWERLDRERHVERGINEDGWGILPDIILEKIFSLLSIQDRYNASIACHQWNRAFYLQKTWEVFELDDSSLTRRKFNYYSGWQQILDHLRTQLFLQSVGKYIRKLQINKMWNLFNLYQFMNMISFYAEKYKEGKGPQLTRIRSLRYIFFCSKDKNNEKNDVIYGTGGELLECLKRLMSNIDELEELELIDLMLDPAEASHLLDDVAVIHCERLIKLTLLNSTKTHFPLIHPACFVNLRILKISPQNLSNENIELLCDNCKYLQELHLIQTEFTEMTIAVDGKSWTKARKKFKVFMRIIGEADKELIWQEKAPVTSILYECPKTKISWNSIITVIDLYSTTLTEYGHLGLAKFWRPKKFDERADQTIVTLCRKCPYLTKLYVRERISTSTVLLIVASAPNLKYLILRRNALMRKDDLESHGILDLDTELVNWIKVNSRDYEKMRLEICKIFGYEWRPLSDKEFKLECSKKVAY